MPALGGLLATLGGLATAVLQVPALTNSAVGKVAVVVAGIGSIIQSVTKPLPKQ
jgi:hypothetical protein